MIRTDRGKSMVKGIKVLSLFAVLFCILLIQTAFVSGNEANYKEILNNSKVNANYPQYHSPDIELQTSSITDTLEPGKTYEYKVQVKNDDNKDITIDPRISANYPIIYPTYAQAGSGQASSVAVATAVQESNNTSVTNVTPIPVSAPAAGYAMPMIPAPNSKQAFSNDAATISAPSTIKAGEIVNMTITVTVPDNATGSYYSLIDMNVNNEENSPYNPRLNLHFSVRQPPTVPFVKTFSTTTDAPVTIEVSAYTHSSDMGTRISPKMEEPSFCVGLTCNGNPVNLTLIKTVEGGNVGSGSTGIGIPYPSWASTTGNSYQVYGENYVETYKVNGAVGDYELSILPKNTTTFGYSIIIGNNSAETNM